MLKKKALIMMALLVGSTMAWAGNTVIKFIERSWDNNQKKVVETERLISDYELLAGTADPDAWALLGSQVENDKSDYYYVVTGDVTYKTMNVFGRAHIILCDGAKLTCTGGILVEEEHNSAKLFIYGQTGDTGRLIVTNSYIGAAGIGSSMGEHNGIVEIHGGNIDVKGGKWAAGIGAGSCGKPYAPTSAGKVTIFGGVVKAEGGQYSAGIGGGAARYDSGDKYMVSDGAEFYLYGGEVTAIGGVYGAGVGGGGSGLDDPKSWEYSPGGSGGQCRIYGGRLTAQGGKCGAGIGSGRSCMRINTGDIRISGGTVNATGGKYAAGIGGGINGDGGAIQISGGNVTAIGGIDAAGIGGGEKGSGGTITISGGNVRAEGRSYGAGIGGGEDGTEAFVAHGADVKIIGGTVIAIAGEDCKGRDDKCGSAIGCGDGVSHKDAEDKAGKLEIADNMRVTAGDAENNIERVFTSGERVPACRWRSYVKIEPCSHETPTVGSDQNKAITYTIDDDLHHTKHCRYCKYTLQEEHYKAYCDCGKLSYGYFTIYNPGTVKDTYEKGETVIVGFDKEFYLPECPNVPAGYKFLGWEMNPDPDDNKWEAMLGEDIKDVGETVAFKLAMDEAKFYPRFLYDFKDEWAWSDDNTSCWLKIGCDALNFTYQVQFTQNFITKEFLNNCVEYSIRYTYKVNGYEYKFSTKKRVPYMLTLQDDADNSAAIKQYKGKTATVSLTGRTLYTDGKWNTLCLPFDVDASDFSVLNFKAVKMLVSSQFNNATGTLTLNFGDAEKIEAGKPYLVRWDSDEEDNIVDYEFDPAVIDNTLRPTETAYVDFVGSFSPVSLAGGDKSVLYLGAANTLYYPQADKTIGSCRALFRLKINEAEARSFVLNFNDETTGVVHTEITEITEKGEAWYTLDGRKLSGKPAQRGVYISNGKKIIIK